MSMEIRRDMSITITLTAMTGMPPELQLMESVSTSSKNEIIERSMWGLKIRQNKQLGHVQEVWHECESKGCRLQHYGMR